MSSWRAHLDRMPRGLGWVAVGLIGFELVYVLLGVLLVKSGGLDRWLNAHPEKRVVRFESAWSVIPGVAHVRNFHMVQQGRTDQFELVVDSATGFVNPLELLARRVHVVGMDARGAEFRYRLRPKTREEAGTRPAAVPPIEGAPFEPYSGPPEEKKRGWAFVFTSASIDRIREVWIDEYRLKGPAELAASVTVIPGIGRKRVSVRSAHIRSDGGEFLSAGESTLRDLALHLEGRMEPFVTKQTSGRALIGLVTASVDLAATSPVAVPLNRYFAKAEWLEFASDGRNVVADLEIEKGRVHPGGFVEFDEAPLRVQIAGFIAEGQATARLDTLPSTGSDTAEARVVVAYTDYGMRRLAEGPAVLHGQGLRIELRSAANLVHWPPEDFEGEIALGKAEFPDLAFVSEFLPEGADVTVRSGRATVDGGFQAREGAACSGRVTITTAGLVIEAGRVEHAGDVALTIEVPEGDLRARTFSLDKTRVELAFANEGEEVQSDWQGRVGVTEGTLDLGEVPRADLRLGLTFSDTRILVAFLSRNEPLDGWKKRMLTIEDEITGEGVVSLTKGVARIRHFGLRGGNVDVRFRALVDSRGAFGKARARYGILKAGIGLVGRERDLKVLRVGTWYKEDDIPGMPPLLPEFEETGAD